MENKKNVKWSDLNKSAKFFVISVSFFVCVAFMILVTELFSSDDKKPSQAPQEVKKVLTRAEQIDNQFSPWDGSHIKLTREIKKGMNDPDSFDHIETRFKDLGNEIVIHESFRGKNSFGGLVINKVIATVDIDGNVLTMKLAE